MVKRTIFKNEHLAPVFEKMMPALNDAGINLWVYGGVAIAGVNGGFVRSNVDVDMCVLDEESEKNFKKAESVLSKMCGENNKWNLVPGKILSTGRPKIDVWTEGNEKEVLSLIPAYEKAGSVEFRWPKLITFPTDEFKLCPVSIDEYSFTMPPAKIVKDLFVHHLSVLPKDRLLSKGDLRDKYLTDAEVLKLHNLMTDEEYNTFFSNGKN